MNLLDADIEKEYIIKKVNLDDEELNSFLFSLGCFNGQTLTVILKSKSHYIISLKDSKYSIDSALAKLIEVENK